MELYAAMTLEYGSQLNLAKVDGVMTLEYGSQLNLAKVALLVFRLLHYYFREVLLLARALLDKSTFATSFRGYHFPTEK